MDNLKSLKETSEKRLAKVIDELNSLNCIFGSSDVEDSLYILRKVRSDYQTDLEYLNSKSEEYLESIKIEFAKELTTDWSIKQIADWWCNKLN
jgi:hypothetical protein